MSSSRCRAARANTRVQAYGEDVELFLLDELEEQIERTVKTVDADSRGLRFHHGSASRSARASSRSSSLRGVSWCRAISRTTRGDEPSARAIVAPRRAWSR